MTDLDAQNETARIAARVTARPRDFLERVERAARALIHARRRCDEIEARCELTRLLGETRG